MNDTKLFRFCRNNLFPALVGDIMDVMGYENQFLPPDINPIDSRMTILGRAMTVQEEDLIGPPINPFGLMFEALDNLKENDVYICTGSKLDYAQWGGLMSNRAISLKGVGAILNGYSRDTKEILSLNFPVFSKGLYSKDQGIRGQVVDYNCTITFDNGVIVNPGDIVFGNCDGVVIIPKQIEDEVIKKAIIKRNLENKVRTSILEGNSTVEVFEKYGIM